MKKKQKKLLLRILLAAVSYGCLELFCPDHWIKAVLFCGVYLLIGYDILRKAFWGIVHLQPMDENLLMTVATVGAMALEKFGEGVAVMLLYQVGELFQALASESTRKSIRQLMNLRPDFARVVRDEATEETDPESVEIGSLVEIRPGERIPIDGVVEKGASQLDASALTGESRPVQVKEGDSCSSGCLNLSSVLFLRTTQSYSASTVSRIMELVESVGEKKTKSEQFITRFARYYTPIVCGAALLLATVPPLVLLLLGQSAAFTDWLFRALTFLVISCPCALIISVPMTFFAGIGGAGKAGILVKGSVYLDALSRVSTVAMDKTGTVTEGVFEVSGVHHCGDEAEKVLRLAASAERYSNHPIALGIRKAVPASMMEDEAHEVQEIPGKGVIAFLREGEVAVGNEKLMAAQGVAYETCHSDGTIVHVALNRGYLGHIVIGDRLKPKAREALASLREHGTNQLVMLTGDARRPGEAVAASLGVDQVKTELLPEDKLNEVESLIQKRAKNERVAFVGDGINDAPVLMRSDVGIAMGALGQDAAIEAADVVLMTDDLMLVPRAIYHGRRCMRIVRENILFVLAVKIICLVLGALGYANMWLAVAADVGVMILAVLNAMRALRCLPVKERKL